MNLQVPHTLSNCHIIFVGEEEEEEGQQEEHD